MQVEPILFKDWADLARTAALSVLTYLGFIVMLRLSGKRTLTKMNVFDFVFVVALGSTLAGTIISSDTNVTRGLVASGTLILLQFVISWFATRSRLFEKAVNGQPALLFLRGTPLKDVMHRERITEDEIRAAVRARGLGPFEQVYAVILETDGSLSIVWKMTDQAASTLDDVPCHKERLAQMSQ